MAGVEEVAGVPFAGGEGVAGGEGHVEFGAEGVEGILPVFGGLGAVKVEDGDEDTVGAEHAGVAGAFPEGEVSSSMDADKGGEEVVLVFGAYPADVGFFAGVYPPGGAGGGGEAAGDHHGVVGGVKALGNLRVEVVGVRHPPVEVVIDSDVWGEVGGNVGGEVGGVGGGGSVLEDVTGGGIEDPVDGGGKVAGGIVGGLWGLNTDHAEAVGFGGESVCGDGAGENGADADGFPVDGDVKGGRSDKFPHGDEVAFAAGGVEWAGVDGECGAFGGAGCQFCLAAAHAGGDVNIFLVLLCHATNLLGSYSYCHCGGT